MNVSFFRFIGLSNLIAFGILIGQIVQLNGTFRIIFLSLKNIESNKACMTIFGHTFLAETQSFLSQLG